MHDRVKNMFKIVVALHFFVLFSIATSPEEMKKLKEVMEKSAREQGIDPNNLKPGETFMVPPEMTDEEEGSRHMPMDHRCAGCIAVAFQFKKVFAAAEKKVKKLARLSDADILEAADDVCDKHLKDYGLKNINGQKKLSGQGLVTDIVAGIMEGGGRWEARLKTLCRELIELYEEEGIYNKYAEKKDQLAVHLCTSYCSKAQLSDMMKSKDEL